MFDNIIKSFEKYPDKNAFCIKNQYFTYSQLEKYIVFISENIIKKLPVDEVFVGVLAVDDILTYSTLLAIMFNGKAYVPINPLFPSSRNATVIKESGIKTIISAVEKEKTFDICGIDTLIYYSSSINKDNNTNFSIFNKNFSTDETPAYLLFTSGSTGVPKGVAVNRRNLFAFCDAFLDLDYNFTADDRFLQMFDLTFDLSVVSYLIPLMFGACVYTVGVSEGIKYMNVYKILYEYEITFAVMVPSIITALKPYFEDIKLEKLKYSLFCGEALKLDIINQWQKCVPYALIQNIYGPTEGTVVCFNYNCIPGKIKSSNGIISIGKPMKNIDALIINDDNKIIEVNEKGELCISGAQIISGYFNNTDKNDKAFITLNYQGSDRVFYKTGDICFKDVEGDYMYCGRTDQQIKVQGYRIEPGEIEYYAGKFDSNIEIVAVIRTNEQDNTEIVIFAQTDKSIEKELYSFMKSTLPSYMLPSEIKLLKSFPYNSNGKINRKELTRIAAI